MRVPELRVLWNQEKASYKRSEVGSGVQRFVWEVLKSPDLFDLSEGLKSTPDHKRRREFLLEHSNKSGQADAVIFADAEVIVPLEVEKFENARSGEWQILKYRTALEKKYGVLTDGNEWRFYYGEIRDEKHYTFTLDEMLDEPARFRAFWSEYIKPENYYLSFFEPVGQRSLSFHDERKSVDRHRDAFFRDVTDIIRKLNDKLLNAGFLKSVADARARSKKATELSYSYLIQFILYKTLVDNLFAEFPDDFAKKSATIHRNLKRGSFASILMILEGLGAQVSENIYKPFHTEQDVILGEVKRIVYAGEDSVLSVAPFLDIFVLIKQYDFANVQNDIFGAIYENYLKELYEQQSLGQFFTDPTVVNFMLEEVGYTAAMIRERDHHGISIIDPSCGSGTFLYSAVREIVKARAHTTVRQSEQTEADVIENVFGLDIAEFPIYLAEMSILMRMLPIIVNEKYNNPVDKKLRLFVTQDSIAEFLDDIGRRLARRVGRDEGQLALRWYDGFMRDEQDLHEMKGSLNVQGSGKALVPRRRFDFVVANPPYIGYNECASAGLKSFQLMKAGDPTISLGDVYGWNLHSAPERRKKYPPKPNLYAFFLALGFALLKDEGALCFIVPQTLLTDSDYDVVRFHLSEHYTIEKLITFAGHLFVGRGTEQKKKVATSSLILVCSKKPRPRKHVVECLHFPDANLEVDAVFGELRTHRSKYTKTISQLRLRRSVDSWAFISWEPPLVDLYQRYRDHSESIGVYSEHVLAEERFHTRFYFDVGYILDASKVVPSTGADDPDLIPIVDFKGFTNFTNFRPRSYYPRDESEIALPKAAQGYEVLHRRHKLVWEKSRSFKFYYTDVDVLPSMSYCQVIASDSREEILFLFAVLNSRLTQRIYRAMFELQAEKHGMFVVVKRIKEFVRTPLVDTPEQAKLKTEVIRLVDRALGMESQTLADVVELDTLVQRFDDVSVSGRALHLRAGKKDLQVRLTPSQVVIVTEALESHFKDEGRLGTSRSISLAELKALPAFSRAGQAELFARIDELVFQLYGLTAGDRRYLLGT